MGRLRNGAILALIITVLSAGTATTRGATGPTDEIVVGLHVSLTGAFPLPAAAVARGASLYWDRSGAPEIHGRSVRLVWSDDNNDPRSALDRCRSMVENEDAFLLVGVGWPDEAQACAGWAAHAGVPYISPGTSEIVMRDHPTYFAASMSYAQQGPLLWDRIKEEGPLSRVAVVYTNSPNYQDARDGFVDAMTADGRTPALERRLSKDPSSSEFFEVALYLLISGAEIVYVLMPSVHYVRLASQLPQIYRPTWVGPGISQGFDDVLQGGCEQTRGAIGNGYFLSPFPGVDAVDDLDPEYQAAYRERHDRDGDDLGVAFWGLNKVIHHLLSEAGPEPTREGFIAAASQATVETGVYPPLNFTPGDPFGAKSAHLLKADCDTRRYVTEELFASVG